MSHPAATLQCPNCGGVFLTIQQNGGGMEICPHCAVAAPRGSYRHVESGEAFPRARTALPGKRAANPPGHGAEPILTTGAIPLPPQAPASTRPPPTPFTPAPFFTPSPQMVATAPTPAWQPQPPPQPQLAAPAPQPAIAPRQPLFAPAPEIQPPPAPAPAVFFAPAPTAVTEAPAPAAYPTPMEPDAPASDPATAHTPPAVSPFLQTSASSPSPSLPPPRATAAIPAPAPAPTPVTADLPPPQIGFASPQEHVPFTKGNRLPPLKVVPSPGSFGPAPTEPANKPVSNEPPTQPVPPPVWPGLGAEGAAAPVETTVITPRANPLQTRRRETDQLAPGWLEAQELPMAGEVPHLPRQSGRLWPWLSLLLVGPPLCGLGLSMWKASHPWVYPAARSEAVSPTATVGDPASAPTAPPVQAPASPATAQVPTPEPPVPATDSPSSGMLPSGEAAEKIRVTQELFTSLQTAPTLDEKLRWIEDGEAHRDAVAKFLGSHPEGLRITTMDPNVGLFQELPSGNEVKLLVATTSACPNGAMVRLHSRGGRELLDWPLFEQTHELDFERFVTRGSSAAPRWFTLLCARSRSSGLEGPAKDGHLALRAQGALSANGEALIHVQRDSEAGHLLESRMTWGRVYLIRIEVERLEVNGKPTLMVVDCEGTTTANNLMPKK